MGCSSFCINGVYKDQINQQIYQYLVTHLINIPSTMLVALVFLSVVLLVSSLKSVKLSFVNDNGAIGAQIYMGSPREKFFHRCFFTI